MTRRRSSGRYPTNWPAISRRVREEAGSDEPVAEAVLLPGARRAHAGWACVRCGHPHDPASGHCLTVHHLDMNPANCAWHNLAALCQKCHLQIQAKVLMEQAWMLDHSEWFKPYVAGYYAATRLGEELSRDQVMERMDELLGLG